MPMVPETHGRSGGQGGKVMHTLASQNGPSCSQSCGSSCTMKHTVIAVFCTGSPGKVILTGGEVLLGASGGENACIPGGDGCRVIAPAVSWVTDPVAQAAGDATGIGLFDVARFIDEQGTLYLLGDDDGVVGPLVGALTAEIAYQSRRIAAQPGRRRGELERKLVLAFGDQRAHRL